MKILVISKYDSVLPTRPEALVFIEMAKMSHDVTIMTVENSPFKADFLNAGIKLIPFVFKKKFSRKEIHFVRKVLEDGKYDIVHVFYNPAMINVAIAARKIKSKVLFYRGYCGNIHWWDPTQYLKYFNPRVDGIWTIAPAVEKLIRRNALFVKPEVFTILKGHNPRWYANITPYPLREKYKLPDDAFIVTMVANARRMKGLSYFIDALTKLPSNFPWYVFLIGKNLKTSSIERKLKRKGIEHKIIFTGHVADPLGYVAGSNCFVLSSIYGEATTKAVLEAMFLRIPCIITDIPGNELLMENMRHGIKVPPRNSEALARAILFYYFHPEVARDFAYHAYEHVCKHFNIQKTAQQLLMKYEEFLLQILP